jgi:hypothetical protein
MNPSCNNLIITSHIVSKCFMCVLCILASSRIPWSILRTQTLISEVLLSQRHWWKETRREGGLSPAALCSGWKSKVVGACSKKETKRRRKLCGEALRIEETGRGDWAAPCQRNWLYPECKWVTRVANDWARLMWRESVNDWRVDHFSTTYLALKKCLMHCFIYVLWFVFLVVITQSRRHWIIFKTLKSKTLSSLSSKASESMINRAYYSFLALFTNYFVHKMMSYSMFTFCII